MDEIINILVIGPSQNGKSTFINKIRELSLNPETPAAMMGDGSQSCTKVCSEYVLTFPRTRYKLVDEETLEDIYVSEDNEHDFFGKLWGKRTSKDSLILPLEARPPTFTLRIIDTPGLDDSHGSDDRNIAQVMMHLHKMQQAGEGYNYISAIIFTISTAEPFSDGFQHIYKYYERCMPNLFGGVAVVNTNFTVEQWKQKFNQFRRMKNKMQQITKAVKADSAKVETMRQRRKDFYEIFDRDARHFFIDSKPSNYYILEELVTRNQIFDIVTYLACQSRMPIHNMKLAKSTPMIQTDNKLIGWLLEAKGKLEQREQELLELSSDSQKVQALNAKQNAGLKAEIEQTEKELTLYDNDSKFTIRTHSTAPDNQMSAPKAIWKWMIRTKLKNTLVVKEDEHPGFTVEAKHNEPYSRWTSINWNEDKTAWLGQYEASPGQTPMLDAITTIANRKHYRKLIERLQKSLLQRKLDLEQAESLKAYLASQESVKPMDPELKDISEIIPQCNDLIETLSADWAPIDSGFNEVSRVRYEKGVEGVSLIDLYRIADDNNYPILGTKLRVLKLSNFEN
ncbi:hypothetical protein ABW20_dc0109623 [Dactylellina cionopaga]|nr:hypothetical protein ABW20_dc0109623 [Dactylellina cionopaga]